MKVRAKKMFKYAIDNLNVKTYKKDTMLEIKDEHYNMLLNENLIYSRKEDLDVTIKEKMVKKPKNKMMSYRENK